jgi:hypothetical protein
MEGVCVRVDVSARVVCERNRRGSKRGEASAGVKEGGRIAMRMRAGKCVLAEARGWMARACEPKARLLCVILFVGRERGGARVWEERGLLVKAVKSTAPS